jgi:hypothetical protein
VNGVFDETDEHYDEQALASLIMHVAMIKVLDRRGHQHQAGGRSVDGPVQLADGESATGRCSVKPQRIVPDQRYGLG